MLIYTSLSLLAVLILFGGIYGCSDNLELQNEVAWKKVCTKWGTSSTKVKDMMRTYSLKRSTSTILTYKGKGVADAISFQFVDDSLCAAVILLDEDVVTKNEIRYSFSNLDQIGEYNASELYVDYKDSTLVTVTAFQKQDKKFISVGYADLGDAVVPK